MLIVIEIINTGYCGKEIVLFQCDADVSLFVYQVKMVKQS